jgi:2-polyprenyl-6-methoxyphenol hydroxylase-like FAD-dependent oxidoreductase
MIKQMGKHAIVVGAGIGGLLFARVLSDAFERVTVLERDSLPETNEPRKGAPQGRHPHGLLPGGCRAMDTLLPGLVDDLKAVGAIKQVMGLSTRFEAPGYDPFPQRDAGSYWYSLSRPMLELCIRRRVQAIPNISLEQNKAVERLRHEGGVVTGVEMRDGEVLLADCVIDASGRNAELTLKVFDEMGYSRPRQTNIGIDLHYSTAVFEIPDSVAYDWKVLMSYSNPPPDSRATMIVPIEGNRWICCLVWHGDEEAPRDRESFLEFARKLRTPTCYQAIKDARMLGKVVGFLFPESRHRHFSELEAFPKGLLPVADVICHFNPLYGQGMSVAALEAEAFCELLREWQGDFHELTRAFLQRTDEIIAVPWNTAAIPDLAYPDTRGERPANHRQLLEFGGAFLHLAALDPSVHKLRLEIIGLLKPYTALTNNTALMQRIQNLIEEMTLASEAKIGTNRTGEMAAATSR